MKISVCIGCGCDDLHACAAGFIGEQPCSWLVVDRRRKVGVCSSCSSMLAAWRGGQRELSPTARRAVADRLHKTVNKIKASNARIPPKVIEAEIDKAVADMRAKRFLKSMRSGGKHGRKL